ncbi:unnamed protein product [Fraxinus pennsylvanica]|uniref:NAC domain-containing protein n=1 Tax=Fraxinus pennsylvanica TaxID=56036 RepID=A0AAD1ZA62_9LAMI|nr:unnamed protein product [Fraxinus pennsylvanica]
MQSITIGKSVTIGKYQPEDYTHEKLYYDDYYRIVGPDFVFHPTDNQIIVGYLINKIKNQKMPLHWIKLANIYKIDPEKLADEYGQTIKKILYLFTLRDEKCQNEKISLSTIDGAIDPLPPKYSHVEGQTKLEKDWVLCKICNTEIDSESEEWVEDPDYVSEDLICLSDLEADYLNPYELASRINAVILFLVTGHWFMFLMTLLPAYYNVKKYLIRQHLIDVIKVFRVLEAEKTAQICKLGFI